MNFPNLTDEEFSDKFMAILNSSKDNTYKFAFARFLIDYSRENKENQVEFSTIAEYFLRYYWVQECRSKLNQTAKKVMKKYNKEKIFVIRKIIHEEFGEKYYPDEFKKIKEKKYDEIKRCIKKIEKKCFGDVIAKRQSS